MSFITFFYSGSLPLPIHIATPIFSPVEGNYTSEQFITISDSTSGAIIKYTTDGSIPSEVNGNIYTTSITVSSITLFKAIAYKIGFFVDSPVVSANYMVSIPMPLGPTFSPPSSSFTGTETISISSSGATTIYYTTDGSTPTTSSLVYSSPITVLNNTIFVLKAIGVNIAGSSTIATDTYNKELASWKNSILNTGGGFTGNSINIASNFLTQLYSKSYQSGIKYLLPLLGSNLSASLVPLRDALGIGKPTNTNFVDADFNEVHGLQGNGTNKILNLGVPPSGIGSSNNGGLGYWENNIPGSANGGVIGMAFNPGDGSRAYLIQLNTGNFSQFEWNQDLGGSSDARYNTPPGNGHYYGQRKSSALRELYLGGVNVATNTVVDPGTSSNAANIRLMGLDTTNIGGITYWGGRCAVAYLTDGTMSASDVTDFHSLLQNYLISPTGR